MNDQKIYLWLDDLRVAPEGFQHVKTVLEAQKILSSEKVKYISLDHDLGTLETGYDLVKWMAETGNWPQQKPQVPSANPVGRQNMLATIERYFPGEIK